MNDKFLIVNAGSSSLKFSLYGEDKEIVNGCIEKIGEEGSLWTIKTTDQKISKLEGITTHQEAVRVMLRELLANKFIDSIDQIKGIGHRVLHGGEYFSNSVVIDDGVLNILKKLIPLGPLHHPGEIAGIESMMEVLPNVLQVAVFDTAFHQTMPQVNYMYPVPYEWYVENGVRKYGFHGTSHKYITNVVKQKLNKEDVNLISCHLGSGASIACIKDGKCYDTSMGLTPLDGLMMGTRSGSIDPSIIEYISKARNMSIENINRSLNSNAGLKGIAGKNDFRDILELSLKGDERGKLALLMFEKSIVKYIAEYYFELNGNVDAIAFTAGIGENSSELREDIINLISNSMGIKLDKKVNDKIARFKELQSGVISKEDSKIKVFVIPTNEEYMIYKDTYDLYQDIKTKVKVR